MGHSLSRLSRVAAPLIMSVFVPSCIYEGEGDCPDRLSFTIKNDWHACSDAMPEGMAYIFFPDDGSEPWRFDFAGREAGKVNMALGKYAFMSYNDDTRNVLFSGESKYDSYMAYTPEKELLGSIPQTQRGESLPKNSDERTVGCPDMMWGCSCGVFSFQYDGLYYDPFAAVQPGLILNYSPDFVLTAVQRPLTARYSFRIEKIENLSGVKSMGAALSGMAGAMLLASRVKEAYPSTLSLEVSIIDAATAGGMFCTFGIPGNPSADNILSLFVVIKDGRRFCYQFDVTDQVRSAPDPMNVSITVSGVRLEKPDTGGNTGFDVAVDGWKTVTVNINS